MNFWLQQILIFASVIAGACLFFWLLPIALNSLLNLLEKLFKRISPKTPQRLNQGLDKVGEGFDKVIFVSLNFLLFPFRLLWNLFVTFLLIKAFILWYGFLLGTVVAVILILVFVPRDNWGFVIFGLPLLILPMYTKMWNKETDT